jgi:hypothetical protein
MAMDAGTYTWSAPQNGQTTDAALAGALTPAGDKAFFIAQEGVDVIEVGCLVGTVTAASSLVFTAAKAPAIAGTYTVLATVTGPAAGIPAGGCLKKSTKIHLDKGEVLRLSITTAAATGTGQLYAKLYPVGSRKLDLVSST